MLITSHAFKNGSRKKSQTFTYYLVAINQTAVFKITATLPPPHPSPTMCLISIKTRREKSSARYLHYIYISRLSACLLGRLRCTPKSHDIITYKGWLTFFLDVPSINWCSDVSSTTTYRDHMCMMMMLESLRLGEYDERRNDDLIRRDLVVIKRSQSRREMGREREGNYNNSIYELRVNCLKFV